MVVLDEVLGAIAADLVDERDVLRAIRERAPGCHVVLTGRDAPPATREAADLVSEVRSLKHHFDAGVVAQRGIEF